MAPRPSCALALGVVVLLSTSQGATAASLTFQVFGGSRQSGFEIEAADDAEPGSESMLLANAPSGSESSDQFAGLEYGVSAMAQPLPLVPFSIGVFAIQQHLKGNAGDFQERITGSTVGAEMMLWVDFGVLQPFLRAGYDLYGKHQYVAEYDQRQFFPSGSPVAARLEMEGRVRGYHGAFGLRAKATPFVGVFAQAALARETLEIERATVMQDGHGSVTESEDFPSVTLDSRSFMIGVDLGT